MTAVQSLRRPTSLAEIKERTKGMGTEEGRAYGRNFPLQPTDVVITPYGKSGTTWLQQIVHGLRTRGDMDFDDISRVVPWLETSYDLGIDLHAPQRGHPRAFKSHLNWHDVPKGGRYIVSVRNPKDVLVSGFRFAEGWFFEPGSISIEEHARDGMLKPDNRGYWKHLLSWWEVRKQGNVLLLSYEAMRRDLDTTVRTVADFVDIALDDELYAIVMRQSSLDFMLRHKDKFDDKLMREHSERVAGLPPGSDSAKVRVGKVGQHYDELPQSISDELDAIWREEITPVLGFASYEDFAAQVVDGGVHFA
ncbi:MAG TPA: sulfotransferase domain-containing protein [Caldilineaceae bacterium]|nr:sulfotransferase domain-containing protein [Caldilineaceae bacterium]